MRQMLGTAKQHSVVILKAGPNRYNEGVEKIVWKRGRWNFTLPADGVLSVVCAIRQKRFFG
jgi:hypothetical protein